MSAVDLDRIVADVRRRAAERRAKQPLERLKDIVREDSWRRERFLVALAREPFAIVAACRRRSPHAGVLLEEAAGRSVVPTRVPAPGPRWFAYAQGCQQGGAAALSVSTELEHYGCSLDDLRAVEFTGLSRVRDDFMIDEAMLLESCMYGADAVVLRPAILSEVDLPWLRSIARELGLAVVMEVRSEQDLERALPLEPELVLAHARDWSTGAIDHTRFERWLARVPTGTLKAAAGGIREADDVLRARGAGAQAVFVGEALLRANDSEQLLKAWRAALGVTDAGGATAPSDR